jgi:hypothetical protein
LICAGTLTAKFDQIAGHTRLAKKAEFEGQVPPFGYVFKNGDHENPLFLLGYEYTEGRVLLRPFLYLPGLELN